MAMASASLFLHGTSDLHLVGKWWDHVNDSEEWQDGIFFLLCAMYSFVAAFTLIQLIRIQNRVPELTWTTQKVFHLLNFIVNAVRALVFGFHHDVFVFHPRIFRIVFLDMPGLLFFSTYSLLVLFWAEIYHQARSSPDERLRPRFIMINAVIYLLQLLIWAYEWWSPGNVVNATAKLFLAVVSFSAAAGFLLYGGRLFLMLRRFPIESKGRRNKLREVGFVTAICFSCFTVRCVVLALSAFDSDLDIDVLDHPILNLVFYVLVEILPSSLVLFILRKLPQKRVSGSIYKGKGVEKEGVDLHKEGYASSYNFDPYQDGPRGFR